MDYCVFCQIARGDAPSWGVYEDESTYAFLNIFPATQWHTLVIPKVHHVDVFDAPVEELVALSRAVKRVVDLYRGVLDISNVQIINSSGAQAQQDVFHVHFHIVPRQAGDGHDIRWAMHPEWRVRFDDMLSELREAGAARARRRGKDADLDDLLRGASPTSRRLQRLTVESRYSTIAGAPSTALRASVRVLRSRHARATRRHSQACSHI